MRKYAYLLPLSLFTFTLLDAQRPNILIIMSDHHATNAISAYDGRMASVAPTPNIDRIANKGILLDIDPHEYNNVYNNFEYAKIVKSLKSRLLDLKKQYADEDEKYPELMKVRREHWGQ